MKIGEKASKLAPPSEKRQKAVEQLGDSINAEKIEIVRKNLPRNSKKDRALGTGYAESAAKFPNTFEIVESLFLTQFMSSIDIEQQ